MALTPPNHPIRTRLAGLQGFATSLSRVPGISEGGGVLSGAVACLLLFVLFGVIGAPISGGGDPGQAAPGEASQNAAAPSETPAPTEGEPATDGGADTTTAEPTATAEPTLTATSTPIPAPDGESYAFSGSSNDVTDSFTTEGGLVVLDFEHDGSSNFQVQAVSSAGDQEFLVNDIGA